MRYLIMALVMAVGFAAPLAAQDINYGNNDGEWASDGECDDRRFYGAGMAATVTWEYVGQDAADCQALYDAGVIKLWDLATSVAATQCQAIDFGDDSGDYPQDGECDDRRFEGLAVAHILLPDYVRKDASDCSRLCAFGVIGLREY